MLQNSWEWKTVNLKSDDGAGSGSPKATRSHSICLLSPPSQKLVLYSEHFICIFRHFQIRIEVSVGMNNCSLRN